MAEDMTTNGWPMRAVVLVLGGLLMVAWSGAAAQETRYISEELEVGVRGGPSNQNRIVSSVRAGQPVAVMEQSGDGWSRVRLPSGNEAWILTRYLQDEPHSRERLEEVEAELAEIRSGADSQEGRIAELLDRRNALTAERDELEAQLADMESELEELRDIASRPQEIQRENRRLEENLIEARDSGDEYRRQVEVMQADSQRKWFMTGALVTVGSVILGIILTRIPSRRRRSEWS
ncbi:TIGR04211 family SH3 domain-containing protein [Thioalkalivibrio sp. ALMg13-2]|uniref:TIGR04211 family SH3 domain-containing protein n=1 Tax=Thioalkalivibrio sp. ALMg13-2 TaxID=1158167 RepID=UPI00037632C2|nr:TIGR04211 family SH3 domain-containing protein [Thioalkalivibrio sp. ALMg13-2]